MIETLFTAEIGDQVDELLYTHANCTLKRAIGPYPIGARIPIINVDLSRGVMEFYSSDGSSQLGRFDLELVPKETK